MKKFTLRSVLAILATVASIAVVSGAVYAANGNSGGTRPGWGNGDKNHEHTGPPGQSVRP